MPHQAFIRAGLDALYLTGAHHLMRPWVGGCGAILMLHHVRPPRLGRFQPNQLLEVTPAFLEDVVRRLRRSKIDLVSMAELHRRLADGDFRRRFVAFTFDDGYRDNLSWAYPILRRYRVPFTIYIPTGFPDRIGELWWVALERVVAKSSRLGVSIEGRDTWLDCEDDDSKRRVFDYLYRWIRAMPDEEDLRKSVRDLAARHDVDLAAICEELCMTWDEIASLASDPLATIGAHTVNHVILAKHSDQAVRAELAMGRSVIEAALGIEPEHLAYPVGDRASAGPREFAIAAELGYKTAVTTRPGVIFPEHRDWLTALPRISLNGNYQQLRHVEVLLSGAATAMWNGFRHVDAA